MKIDTERISGRRTGLVHAAPDGYTFLFTLSSHTINLAVYDRLPAAA